MDILGHTNGILFVSICFDAITPITCHFPVKLWLVVLCMHHSEGRGCFRHIRRIALPRMQYTRQHPSSPSPSLSQKLSLPPNGSPLCHSFVSGKLLRPRHHLHRLHMEYTQSHRLPIFGRTSSGLPAPIRFSSRHSKRISTWRRKMRMMSTESTYASITQKAMMMRCGKLGDTAAG
jgi:hypothetical protein